jgi:hypothetical protein
MMTQTNHTIDKLINQTVCRICSQFLSAGHTYSLECNHIFHDECIKKWISYQQITSPTAYCPLCRQVANHTIYQFEDHYGDYTDDDLVYIRGLYDTYNTTPYQPTNARRMIITFFTIVNILILGWLGLCIYVKAPIIFLICIPILLMITTLICYLIVGPFSSHFL